MISIRKIGVLGRTYRNLNRYRQILSILFKYGFGDLVEHLKIEQYIEIGLQMISKKRRARMERLSRAERMRLALEELGPTYIKLGQLLSTRPDLVPVEFINELAKLQDRVPPYPFVEFVRIVDRELGHAHQETFEFLHEAPLASASIGQVHLARLTSGENVVVKVQRPGIHRVIEVDLEIMLHMATLMERHIEELALHRPVKIVEEFARTIERELDYTIEAANMERVSLSFLSDDTVYIPKVYRELTTHRMLTAEFVDGIKVSDTERLDRVGMNRHLITQRGADILLTQVFQHGFFHADPHPGNIFVLPGNVICLLDFGMMGSVERTMREDFVELVDCVVRRDPTGAVQILLKITLWDHEPDQRLLERDVGEFMGMHLYKPLRDIVVAKLLQDLLEVASRHRLRIPPQIFLMLKALSTVEGVARKLDPGFDMIARAEPFIRGVKMARLSPQRISSDLVQVLKQAFDFAQNFPKEIMQIVQSIRRNRLTVQLEFKGLETMLHTHDQISNRISFSIIIGALIIGSALIVISKTPPLYYGISLIGIIGFLAAALMGVWLLVAIIRKGRL
jgi:ubiquinone biosynthesis protein